MKKTLIRILSIVLCLTLVSGGSAFSSALVPATNTDAVATPDVPATPDIPATPDEPEVPVTGATPFRISVVVNGDTKTSKGITWYTKDNTSSKVELDYGNAAHTAELGVDYDEVFEFEGNYVHKAKVTGLMPGREYKYRVGDGTTFSDWGSFVTDDGDSKVEFIAVADVQASNLRNFEAGARVINTAFDTMPGAEFMLNLGDFTNDSTNEEWDYYDEAMAEINLNTTLAPIAGNHDGLGVWDWFNNMFNLDTSESVQNLNGVNYSFDYGNAHIAVLNTNDLLSVSFAQLTWLKNDMNSTDKDWKIVCMHKSPFTLGKDGKWPDALYLKRSLTAVVDMCDIDLVMSGHDHQYLRTQPIRYGMVNEEEGATYVLAGTAGTKRYGVRNFLEGYMMNTKHIAALTTQNDGHYWDGENHDNENELYKGGIFNTIAVDGGKLTFNSYVVSDLKEDEEGNIIDKNEVPTVTLHDSFTLEKEVGQNEITFTGDNTTSEAEYYLGAVPSFLGLAAYTFIEWLPRFLSMLPALLVDVVFMDGSF